MGELFDFVAVVFMVCILCLLVSCKSVVITDQEWCGDMGPDGATCFHTLSATERGLTKPEWDSDRFGMLCTKSNFFADNKGVIEKLCHETGDCDFQAMSTFIEKTQRRKGRHP